MMLALLIIICATAGGARAAAAATAEATADEVFRLPGWSDALPSAHFSGYLSVRGGDAAIHYYLQGQPLPSRTPSRT